MALRILLLAVGLASTPVPGTAQQGTPLQAAAESIVEKVSGEWGVVAWSVQSRRPLISINGSSPLVPASNNKVFTAIWALDLLGPDYRFATDLLVDGPILNEVLHGDVIIRGSGDPAFGYPPRLGLNLFIEEPMTPLHKMAQRLAQEGVRVVEGSVIGDPTVFDSLLVGPAWPNDTGGGAAQYAPRVSGLPFQRNMVWVEANASSGNPVQVRLDPPVPEVPLVSTLRSGGGRALAVRRAHEDTIRISGAVSGRGTLRYGVGVSDPALLTAAALRLALQQAGIEVRGAPRVGRTPASAAPLHRHLSIPLGTMVPFLNQHSDNFFAEHLWKASAAKALGQGSYLRGGPASALHFMRNAEVPAGEMYQFDGSGLSSYSRASANSLVRALVYADEQPYSELWHQTFAIAGERTGTLNRLYRSTPAEGNLHAKTGYIRRVRTLSGYVTDRSGELIAFSFLYNGANTNGARSVQEELGVLLAEHGDPLP